MTTLTHSTKQAELNGQPVPRLHVRSVFADGVLMSQSWVYRVTIAGGVVVQRGLGSIDGRRGVKVPLMAAVKQARVLDGELAQGKNPFVKSGKQQTFGQVMLAYAAKQEERGNWALDAKGKCGTAEQWRKWLATDMAELGRLRFDNPCIDDAVLAVVEPIWGSKKCDDLRGVIGKTFRRAKALGIWHGENPVEGERMVDLYGKGRDGRGKEKGGDVEHHAMLPHAELPALLATLALSKGMAATALRFLILTTARSSNVRFACKSNIDRQARTWTIPADGQTGERMKAGVEHVYYLNDQAMEIVNALWEQPGDYLFTGKTGVLGSTALDDKLCDPKAKGGLGYRGAATVHGMRASFQTWAHELTQFGDIADAMLAHAEGKVRAAYQRSDAAAKMTAVSQLWGNYCAGISKPVMLQLVA